MIILLVSLVFTVGYLLFRGLQFANFKSKLMNEFGVNGIEFSTADEIYSQKKEQIHELHHNGVPVAQIVSRILAEVEHQGHKVIPSGSTDKGSNAENMKLRKND